MSKICERCPVHWHSSCGWQQTCLWLCSGMGGPAIQAMPLQGVAGGSVEPITPPPSYSLGTEGPAPNFPQGESKMAVWTWYNHQECFPIIALANSFHFRNAWLVFWPVREQNCLWIFFATARINFPWSSMLALLNTWPELKRPCSWQLQTLKVLKIMFLAMCDKAVPCAAARMLCVW